MKRHKLPAIALGLLTGLFLVVVLWANAAPPSSIPLSVSERQETQRHTAWIVQTLKRIQTIKPGDTRADLLKAFTTEGGLSNSTQRIYVDRTCPNIKVNVEFRIVDRPQRDAQGRVPVNEHGKDIITKICKPYLDWSIMD